MKELKLVQFYRELFLEAAQQFEPVWKEEQDVMFGYRWHKNDYLLTEQFQITDAHPSSPLLMYSIVLPESYLQTTIYEEIKGNRSTFELSIVISNRKLWLNAALHSDDLQGSLMEFLHQTRGELMNIIDCTIQLADDRFVLANPI